MEFVNLTQRSKLYLFFYFLFNVRVSIVLYPNLKEAKQAAKYLQDQKFKTIITKENGNLYVSTVKKRKIKWKKH